MVATAVARRNRRRRRWRRLAGRPAVARQATPDYWPTDGWRVADPVDHGVDPFALDAVDARVPAEVPALSALLAVRHGYLVFERYYGGHDPEHADQHPLGDQERHRHAGGRGPARRICSTVSSKPSAS